MFKTIKDKSLQAEIVEKKSKFIANIFYVENIEEAENKINEIKKKYYDARHNCFAYSIYTKERRIDRFSDDGEPSGTAGAPMLNILTSQNLCNVVVIVTRYFGGILLGTGGLVRAYTEAMQQALVTTNFVNKDIGVIARIEVSYQDLEKAKYYLKQKEINIADIEYSEKVNICIETINEKINDIIQNKNNLNFEIIDMKKVGEKYIEL